MERFVRFVVGGGLLLLPGLWTVELSAPGTAPWLLGAVLGALGAGGLLFGIGSEIEWP